MGDKSNCTHEILVPIKLLESRHASNSNKSSIDFNGIIEDIKQNIAFRNIWTHTIETYMVHGKSIQQKQLLHLIFSCKAFIHYYCSETVCMW